jgi:hypothetical protein
VAYPLQNALFQWREGERRVDQASQAERVKLERAVDGVVDELRRRLGSSFLLEELAAFYGAGTDWATDLVARNAAGTDAAAAVDAAFNRYAREASNYGGGRARRAQARP